MKDSVWVNVPIEVAFAWLTDFQNTPKWHQNMLKWGWKSEGPYGMGSEYDWVETFMGMKMDIGGVITEWNPPYSFAWKPTTSPFPITGGWKLVQKEKATLITRYSDNQLKGIYKLDESNHGSHRQATGSPGIAGAKTADGSFCR